MEPAPFRLNTTLTIVSWIIWFSILNGLVMIQFFAGGGIPQGENQGNPPVMFMGVAAVLALVALTIRFVVIPQIMNPAKKLPVMVVGLALSELIGFVGMFVVGKDFPETRLALFVSAIVCILSFAPFYMRSRLPDGRP